MGAKASAKRTGRPTDLTPAVQARIVAAIEDGNYISTSAEAGGVTGKTVREWMARGERGEEPFKSFRAAVHEAEAKAEATIVSLWRQQIPENWQAARDFLARRHPSKWAETHKVLALVEQELDRAIDDLANGLSPEVFEQVAEILARRADGGQAGGSDDES